MSAAVLTHDEVQLADVITDRRTFFVAEVDADRVLATVDALMANRTRVAQLVEMLILGGAAARQVEAQRDELLEALEMVRDADNDRVADDGPKYGIPSMARAKIDAAIARARGGK